jgi:hypothetical protein
LIGVDAELADVASWLEDSETDLVDAIVARQRTLDSAAPLIDSGARDAAASLLGAIRAGLTTGRATPAHLPPGAVQQAAVAAAEGVPWSALARTYAVAHAVVWEHLIAQLAFFELDAAHSAALLRVLSRYLFDLIDHVTMGLAEVYAAERERLVRDSECRKAALVRDLLAGLPVAPGALAYELRSEHIGAIAWGAEPGAAAAQLAAETELRLLTVAGGGDVVWAWLGGRPTIAARAARTLARVHLPPETYVALGDPAAGPEGFRSTHRQAGEAQRVALLRPRPLTRYDDVALESLALQDVALARAFAERELGPLGAPGERAAVLRETLRAYFTTGQNASAVAAMLGIHERTVSYRLQSAGVRLGRPVAARRDELAVALRILAVLEPDSAAVSAVPSGVPSRTPGAVV